MQGTWERWLDDDRRWLGQASTSPPRPWSRVLAAAVTGPTGRLAATRMSQRLEAPMYSLIVVVLYARVIVGPQSLGPKAGAPSFLDISTFCQCARGH